MPTTKDDKSRNAFESDRAGTEARTRAEGKIEDLRLKGGLFVDAVRATRMAMAVTDPTLPGNPIIFANRSFLKLSGYSMEEVLGQQPHFLNGPDTDPDDVARFEEALRSDQDDLVETIQYRKDGTRFIASVLLSAFKDDDGNTVHHFLSWLDVTRRTNAENRLNLLQQAQNALRHSEAELSAELSDATLLRDLALKLVTEESLPAIYEEILGAAIAITNAAAGTVQIYDPATKDLVLLVSRGFPKKMTDHFSRVDASRRTACGVALKTGQRTFVDFDQGAMDEACSMHVEAGYLSAQATPLVSRAGEALGMLNTHWSESGHRPTDRELRSLDLLARQAADLIERRATEAALRDSEQHQRLLLGELQHRVRNTLAVIRAIARRTAENTTTAEDMLAHFQGRLDAFSRVQAALIRSPDATVDLASLIDDELVAHAAREGETITVDGPDVVLEPKTAERLSLAIHELTTNAVKHGALMNGGGRIDVRWTSANDRLALSWTESGVKVDADDAQGHEALGCSAVATRRGARS